MKLNSLWEMFIRPTRSQYGVNDLGPEVQVFGQFKSRRSDFVILNKNSQKLQCSLFEPMFMSQHSTDSLQKYPCVVYCHCNSGSRLEALRILPDIIKRGMALFCFDFAGSGLSDGEYVTLGINESTDLETVIAYLQEQPKVSNISLWGRSMGAVTCILYASKLLTHRPVKGIVFDSGFSNLKILSRDFAKLKTGFPGLLIDSALSLISDQVKERVTHDIQSIDLAKIIHTIYVPCYFLTSKEDSFVKSEQVEQLHMRYNGQKWIEYIPGEHNASRSNALVDKLANWISSMAFDSPTLPSESHQSTAFSEVTVSSNTTRVNPHAASFVDQSNDTHQKRQASSSGTVTAATHAASAPLKQLNLQRGSKLDSQYGIEHRSLSPAAATATATAAAQSNSSSGSSYIESRFSSKSPQSSAYRSTNLPSSDSRSTIKSFQSFSQFHVAHQQQQQSQQLSVKQITEPSPKQPQPQSTTTLQQYLSSAPVMNSLTQRLTTEESMSKHENKSDGYSNNSNNSSNDPLANNRSANNNSQFNPNNQQSPVLNNIRSSSNTKNNIRDEGLHQQQQLNTNFLAQQQQQLQQQQRYSSQPRTVYNSNHDTPVNTRTIQQQQHQSNIHQKFDPSCSAPSIQQQQQYERSYHTNDSFSSSSQYQSQNNNNNTAVSSTPSSQVIDNRVMSPSRDIQGMLNSPSQKLHLQQQQPYDVQYSNSSSVASSPKLIPSSFASTRIDSPISNHTPSSACNSNVNSRYQQQVFSLQQQQFPHINGSSTTEPDEISTNTPQIKKIMKPHTAFIQLSTRSNNQSPSHSSIAQSNATPARKSSFNPTMIVAAAASTASCTSLSQPYHRNESHSPSARTTTFEGMAAAATAAVAAVSLISKTQPDYEVDEVITPDHLQRQGNAHQKHPSYQNVHAVEIANQEARNNSIGQRNMSNNAEILQGYSQLSQYQSPASPNSNQLQHVARDLRSATCLTPVQATMIVGNPTPKSAQICAQNSTRNELTNIAQQQTIQPPHSPSITSINYQSQKIQQQQTQQQPQQQSQPSITQLAQLANNTKQLPTQIQSPKKASQQQSQFQQHHFHHLSTPLYANSQPTEFPRFVNLNQNTQQQQQQQNLFSSFSQQQQQQQQQQQNKLLTPQQSKGGNQQPKCINQQISGTPTTSLDFSIAQVQSINPSRSQKLINDSKQTNPSSQAQPIQQNANPNSNSNLSSTTSGGQFTQHQSQAMQQQLQKQFPQSTSNQSTSNLATISSPSIAGSTGHAAQLLTSPAALLQKDEHQKVTQISSKYIMQSPSAQQSTRSNMIPQLNHQPQLSHSKITSYAFQPQLHDQSSSSQQQQQQAHQQQVNQQKRAVNSPIGTSTQLPTDSSARVATVMATVPTVGISISQQSRRRFSNDQLQLASLNFSHPHQQQSTQITNNSTEQVNKLQQQQSHLNTSESKPINDGGVAPVAQKYTNGNSEFLSMLSGKHFRTFDASSSSSSNACVPSAIHFSRTPMNLIKQYQSKDKLDIESNQSKGQVAQPISSSSINGQKAIQTNRPVAHGSLNSNSSIGGTQNYVQTR